MPLLWHVAFAAQADSNDFQVSAIGVILRMPGPLCVVGDARKRFMNSKRREGSRVRNDLFDRRKGFDLGRSRPVFVIWYLLKSLFFLSAIPWPSRFKSGLLRLFGAEVGQGVNWKPRVNIHIPWKLKVGDYTWVGEEVCIINFAPISIGAHCCLSQRSFLCSGNHNYRLTDMQYQHAPIVLENGVWVGAGAFIGPGVTVGADAVIIAMSLAIRSLEGAWVYVGQPCTPMWRRWEN
jgi:putative colanic acid biosynthesis acetyltransferase WcaF